jgi:23S rRNA (uracil1939-C5)-methyltransferase
VSVAKDQIIEIEITDLGDGGEGIGRYEGMTIFVDGGIIGDVVKAKITFLKKKYAIGKVVGLVTPSPFRIEPACPHFRKCGGCQIMNMDYEKGQLAYKEKVVKDAMERIGGFKETQILPIIGMADPLRYRNKGQYPVAKGKDGLEIGFFEKGTHKVVDVHDCLLQSEAHVKVNQLIRDYVNEFNISIYDEATQKGLLRHVMIRHSAATGDMMVVLVINGSQLINESVLKSRIRESVPEVKSLIINKNKSYGNRVLGFHNKVILGTETIEDQIGDLKFAISPLSFFQVNPGQTEALYGKAMEYADLKGDETVFDIYCGIGTISLFLAQKAKRVIGVEMSEAAVLDAEENAKRNGFTNCEFHVGLAEEVIPKLYEEGYKADVVLVDPPRKGCEPQVLETMLAMAPKKIVYVSCKPSTMARDLKILCESGEYEVIKVQPVDQFGMTVHVECVAELRRK